MKPVHMLLAIVALPLSFYCQAQGRFSPDSAVKTPQERGIRQPSDPSIKASPDPGAVVVPPKVDPGAIETPPKHLDPDISKPPPATFKEKPAKSQRKRKLKPASG